MSLLRGYKISSYFSEKVKASTVRENDLASGCCSGDPDLGERLCCPQLSSGRETETSTLEASSVSIPHFLNPHSMSPVLGVRSLAFLSPKRHSKGAGIIERSEGAWPVLNTRKGTVCPSVSK